MKTPVEMDVRYRHCGTLENNYAVAATFVGQPGTAEQIEKLLEASTHKRRTTQPRESSAGCIFNNPEQSPAGKLVDELGLKGASIGGAKDSEVHGNFIVNDGGATASDVLAMIDKVKDAAWRERGIKLETEVQIVGDEKGIHD